MLAASPFADRHTKKISTTAVRTAAPGEHYIPERAKAPRIDGVHAVTTETAEHRRPVTYEVKIDKEIYKTKDPTPTGRELLLLAGKIPPEQFAIYRKPKEGRPIRIELNERVDLREPGIERFVTLPLDQTEGLGGERRQFVLPAEDTSWLNDQGFQYELVRESVPRVIVRNLPLPTGYTVDRVDVNVRIEPGYPDAQIDMAYFYPALARRDGRPIGATSPDSFDGKVWQRWSRHRTPANPWRPGVDNLSTHFALIEHWLAREITK